VNKKEIQNLLGWATANYPNMQEKDMGPTAALWEKMLSDIPYKVAEKALIKVLAVNKFFPSVAEIREAAAELTAPVLPSWLEAWDQAIRASSDYGYSRQQEAFTSMQPEVAVFVRRFGWHDICYSDNQDVMRGQFRQAWEVYAKNAKETAQLPEGLRKLVSGTAGKLMIERGV
jgi:hypothetical protein